MAEPTLPDLDALVHLAAAASPLPWAAWWDHGVDVRFPDDPTQPAWLVSFDPALLGHRDYRVVCRTVRMTKEVEAADATYVAAAANAVPTLCAEVKRLRAENEALRTRLTPPPLGRGRHYAAEVPGPDAADDLFREGEL